jgi:hypothetical protein
MLAFLPNDMLFEMIKYLTPHEFQQLYLSLQDEMLKQCTIECTVVIKDELVEWFECNNIKINLLDEIEKDGHRSTTYYRNGKIHRDNDLPAYISKDCRVQVWYQNGNIHRNDNKPAHIIFNPQSDRFEMTWVYKNTHLATRFCGSKKAANHYEIDISTFV